MRIGIFTDYYFPVLGGITTAVASYRQGLEALGHEVYIFTAKRPNSSFDDEKVVSIATLPGIEIDASRVVSPSIKLISRINSYQLDIIHTHAEGSLAMLGLYYARKQRIPVLHTVHTIIPEMMEDLRFPVASSYSMRLFQRGFNLILPGGLDLPRPKTSHIKSRAKRKTWDFVVDWCNNYSYLVVPSAHLAEKLTQHGVESAIEVIPNGVDTSLYEPSLRVDSPMCNLVAVQRLSKEKRVDVILEAVASLPSSYKFNLSIVGTGPQRHDLEAKAKELGLERKVNFLGRLEPAEVRGVLSRSSLFILASYQFDNQPMAILEALSSGLPILYCDPSLKEGLDDNNSLCAAPDSQSIAEALVELMDDPQRRKAMGQDSLEKSQYFDTVILAERLLKMYSRAIAN